MKIGGILNSRSINKVIRIADAVKSEKQHTEKRYRNKINFIDKEARKSFAVKKIIISMIKCSHRFNYYGL